MERLSGDLKEIQWLSDMSRRAGHYAVIADDECVLVMHDLGQLAGTDFERAGIIDGSCWTEQIAATNGVGMALRHRRTVTVTGSDHYYALLSRFMCTASPIYDHEDEPIGAINVSALDRGDIRDRSFAEHILRMATNRIQARLFHEHFSDLVRTAISSDPSGLAEGGNALLAVDGSGVIRGATRAAARALGKESALPLIGRQIETVIDLSVDRLVSLRDEPTTVERDGGLLTLKTALPKPRRLTHYGTVRSLVTAAPTSTRITLADCEGMDNRQRTLVRRLKRLFNQGLPLFVMGETGLGKRTLAHALHFEASVGQAPMVTIDPADHDGAGPAARVAHQLENVRALAQGGLGSAPVTLCIRDAGHLAAPVQYQIAHFLSELELAGESDSTGGRIRLVATGGPNADRQILPELRSHIAGEVATLPPLRQRKDIEAVISGVFDRLDDRCRLITPAAMSVLCHQPWPGNFRELKLVLRRAALLAGGDSIGLHDLPDAMFVDRAPAAEAGSDPTSATDDALIRDALASTDWNMSEAARRCGISRATMHRRVKALGLVRPRAGRLAALQALKSAD